MGMPGDFSKGSYPEPCEHEGCDLKESAYEIQGETDSFGCEYMYFCEEHGKMVLEEMKKPRVGSCDFCQTETKLKATRDPEEGMNGPVYDLCPNCRDAVHWTASNC